MTEIRVLVGTVDFGRSSAFYGDLLGSPSQSTGTVRTAAARFTRQPPAA